MVKVEDNRELCVAFTFVPWATGGGVGPDGLYRDWTLCNLVDIAAAFIFIKPRCELLSIVCFAWVSWTFLSCPRTPEKSSPIFVQHRGQSKDGTDDLMSVSRAGDVIQTPISSMYKNVDHIIRYAKSADPMEAFRNRNKTRITFCQTFSLCVSWETTRAVLSHFGVRIPTTSPCFWFPPPSLFRFWIWEFLSTWEASCHMVRQPTLCCSRGLWGPTVWGSTAGHLGEMLKNTTLGFIYLHLDSSDMCLCVFSCSEYGGGAVRAGVWCVTIWWTNSACTPTESPGRKVPYPLLHDWR